MNIILNQNAEQIIWCEFFEKWLCKIEKVSSYAKIDKFLYELM